MIDEKRTKELWDALHKLIREHKNPAVSVSDMSEMAHTITTDTQELFLLGSMAGTIAFNLALIGVNDEKTSARKTTH